MHNKFRAYSIIGKGSNQVLFSHLCPSVILDALIYNISLRGNRNHMRVKLSYFFVALCHGALCLRFPKIYFLGYVEWLLCYGAE